MGCVDSIKIDKFPEQGRSINKEVKVCFHYDTDNFMFGRIVRDDIEEPFKTIILLNNGNYVEASECQYSKPPTPKRS